MGKYVSGMVTEISVVFSAVALAAIPLMVEPWPDTEYDAALHLLDRQVVDVDGMAVGKVDDVELTEDPDGSLVATGLLIGLAALLPRLGDRAGDWLFLRYVRLSVAHAGRGTPGVVDLGLVEDVTSEVHLSVKRDGLVRPRAESGVAPVRRRLGALLAMRVVADPSAGIGALRVLDARLSPAGRISALVVGRGRPGSLLGYDRKADQGPWPVAHAVRRLHRHSRVVDLAHDVDIDWEAGQVRIGPGPGADTEPVPH